MTNSDLNRIKDTVFKYFGVAATLFGVIILAIFIADIFIEGISRIDYKFLTGFPSRIPKRAGILPAIAGTLWIMCLTAFVAIPIGVAAGIYLEEYNKKNRWTSILEVNINNLAGVPSIIYGLLGVEIFARMMHLGSSLLTGALTLSLLILPVIIVATREAIRTVPKSIREGSFALGATKWQTIWHQILPASAGGILTGVILALSRAIGETAPIIVIGGLAYIRFVPNSPMDDFSILPMQIFNWISRPQKGFLVNAAASILILLLITFVMNGIAIYLRNRWQNKTKW